MFEKIFLDANILVDFVDDTRKEYAFAKTIIIGYLSRQAELFTSCDIITTVYYLSAKKEKKKALEQIGNINRFCTIIEFSNKEVANACALMSQNSSFCDLEDTLQYFLAKKAGCEVIISNDKDFFSPDLKLLNSKEFCEKYGATL